MTHPLITELNCTTGEAIDRPMTGEELKQFEDLQDEKNAQKLQAEAKAAQKAALLDRLGITEDEAKLLLA